MIGDKIKERRLELGLTQSQLSNITGIKSTTISNYENNISSPNEKNLFLLFSALKCDANYLFEWEQNEELNLTLGEKKHIKKYRTLDEYGKRAINELLDTEYERCTAVPEEVKPEIVHIKLAQLPASAGTGVDLYEENYEIMSVRASDLTKQADFAVRVSGDSMESTFFDGDILLIESMPYINVGDIGIFVVNGDGFVKEYGGDRLISHNDKYPDIKLTEHDVVICSGRVIGALEESDFID